MNTEHCMYMCTCCLALKRLLQLYLIYQYPFSFHSGSKQVHMFVDSVKCVSTQCAAADTYVHVHHDASSVPDDQKVHVFTPDTND